MASMPKLYDSSPVCPEDKQIDEPIASAIDFFYPRANLKKVEFQFDPIEDRTNGSSSPLSFTRNSTMKIALDKKKKTQYIPKQVELDQWEVN